MSSGSDKRQVATDALETLGTVIGPRKEDGTADARYYCVSLEHTDYRPVQATEILNVVESGVW